LTIRAEMAWLMSENGQSEEAEKEIARVVAAKPKDSKLLERAGDLFFKGKPAQAADYYKRSLEADPANNRARVQLGASLVRSMQIEAAMPVLADAISREPDNYAAHASTATALFKKEAVSEAARRIHLDHSCSSRGSASYYFLAISFDHLGDCEQALRAYKEFVRKPTRHRTKAKSKRRTRGRLNCNGL
jgi:predicted Zn-dependent protease